jgi:glyoxylase I family protein
MILQFSHTGICVSDLQRSIAFYRDVFGFKQHHSLHFEGEPAAKLLRIKDLVMDVVYLERDGTVIELLYFKDRVESQEVVPREINKIGLTHISFNVDEMGKLLGDIEEAGGAILSETLMGDPDGPSAAVFATDPDGTLIELVQAPVDPTRLPLQPDDLVR